MNCSHAFLYTNECSANPFVAAKQTAESGLLSDSSKARLNDPISAVTASARSQWDKKASIFFGSEENKNSLIYRLENGVQVREVSVNTEKGGAPLEIVRLTDFHLKEASYRDNVSLLRKLMGLSVSADKVIPTATPL